MRRTTVFVLFAFIGFVIAFASALPGARPAAPRPQPAITGEHDVPAAWVARALADMSLLFPTIR